MIKEVRFEIIKPDMPAYYNVKVEMGTEGMVRGYVPAEMVLSSDDLHNQVVADAVRELRYWQKLYENLKEMSHIINEDELIKVEESLK